jgi:hypothetical protein
MKIVKRTIATIELLLVFPAALFMTALFVRNIQPTQYEPAHSAQRLVDWFSKRPVLGLDVCLIALPFAAFVIGCFTVWRQWRRDAQFRDSTLNALAAIHAQSAAVLIAGATLVAGGVLGIVALHVITD